MKAPPIRFYEDGAQYAERLRQDYLPLLNALDAPFRAVAPEPEPTPQAAVVPSSNRGLKSPDVERSEAQPALAHIDYLTFTAPVACLMPGEFGARIRAEAVKGCETSIELLARHVLRGVDAPGLTLDSEVKGFRDFYAHSMVIRNPQGDVAGLFKIGGESQRGTFCLELKGEGCAHVRAWAHTRAVLETWGAKLTRVDCAHDDKQGTHTLADVERWYAQGEFTTRGRPPAFGRQGYTDGSGETIYIGKNTGNQQLCVYEKGKQLGDRESPWVRFEARFGAKYREIPLDVLERPHEYLIGHYKPLGWISELSTRMQTAAAKAAASMTSSLRHAKRQCGAVVHAIAEAIPDPIEFAAAVVSLLKRPKLPKWAQSSHLGAAVILPALTPQLRPMLA